MNPGKKWEKKFSRENPATIIRLYDTTNGYVGIKNPCDFLLYSCPYFYPLECKSVTGKRFYFSGLTDNQQNQLTQLDKKVGVISLVCVEFRQVQEAYAIPHRIIRELINEGKKSISHEYCNTHHQIVNITFKQNGVIDWELLLLKLNQLGGVLEGVEI